MSFRPEDLPEGAINTKEIDGLWKYFASVSPNSKKNSQPTVYPSFCQTTVYPYFPVRLARALGTRPSNVPYSHKCNNLPHKASFGSSFSMLKVG